MGEKLDKFIKNITSTEPIKNVTLGTHATITELDKRTVGDINKAVAVLKNKKQSASPKTQTAIDKQITRLEEQKNKTLKLFRKYKKDSRLKSLSASSLSVYKIWTLLGRKPKEIETSRDSFGKWLLQNKGENLVGVLGASTATVALLFTKVGNETIGAHLMQGLFTGGDKALFPFLASNLGPGGIVALGGAGVLAGVIVAKKIRKKRQQEAAAKEEAEELMNQGTAYDHETIAESKSNKEIFDRLVAEALADKPTREFLIRTALNSNNDPAVVKQATEILAEVKIKQAQNKYNAERAVIEANLSSGKIKKYPEFKINGVNHSLYDYDIDKLIKRGVQLKNIQNLKENAEKDLSSLTYTNSSVGDELTFVNGLNLDAIEKEDIVKLKNRIKGKSKEDYIAGFGLDESATADKTILGEIYDKMSAIAEYCDRKDAGEFTVNGTDISIEGIGPCQIEVEYDVALVNAFINANILTEDDVKKLNKINDYKNLATKLKNKYGSQIAEARNNIEQEMIVERTGNVKGL